MVHPVYPGMPECLNHCISVMQSKACCCRCDYVDFDVAVFTNVTKDKVDEFGGIKQYLNAQGSLFLKLQDPTRQRAVVNTDGERAAALAHSHCTH